MPTLLVRVPQRTELIEFYTHTHTNIYTVLSIYRESEKAGLKLNIQKLRSWHLSPSLHGKYMAKKWKLTDFIFLGSKITADSDCSQEIRRQLLYGRKVMISLDSLLKSRNITLPTKVRIFKAIVFPVVT